MYSCDFCGKQKPEEYHQGNCMGDMGSNGSPAEYVYHYRIDKWACGAEKCRKDRRIDDRALLGAVRIVNVSGVTVRGAFSDVLRVGDVQAEIAIPVVAGANGEDVEGRCGDQHQAQCGDRSSG